MEIQTIDKVKIKGKKIFLRVDINSSINKGKILDSPRMDASSKLIKKLIGKKAKVVVIAHQGRKGDDDFLDLRQHALILSKKIGKKIRYVDYLFDEGAIKEINKLKDGEAIVLKNVREYEDEKNVEDPNNKYINFCKNFDYYINDAFSVCHRAQGSIVLPPKFLKSFAGDNLFREVSALSKINLNNKKSKGLFFLGGHKIEDYFPIFNVLANKNNKVIASGVLANLILYAKGVNLGYENKWIVENGYDKLSQKIKDILAKYENQIILPIDFAVGSLDKKERNEIKINNFPDERKILDVGNESVKLIIKELEKANVVFMKGPLGFSEKKEFSYGTIEVLKKVSSLSKSKKIFSILGGGHLTTTMDEYKIKNNFSYISLSGGALIAYVSGEKLPGIEALKTSKN